MDWTALGLTLRLAGATTLVLFVLGVPLAYWLATTRWRFRFIVETLVMLPLVLPPTVVGFYSLLAMGPQTWIGRWYEKLVGSSLPFSFEGILLASVLYNLPFSIRPFTAAFASLDRELVDAAACLGVRPLETFRRVILPLSWTGLVTGLVLTFAHTLGEFGVVLMVGGNIPGVTRTLSLAIYDDVQALRYEAAQASALCLLVTAFALMGVVFALRKTRYVL